MSLRGVVFVFLGLCWVAPEVRAAAVGVEPQAIARELRTRLEVVGPGSGAIHAVEALPLFYERRHYLPAWTGGPRRLAAARELVDFLRESESHGLRPSDYHLEAVESLLAARETLNPQALGDLDLLLTDAFLILGAHLVSGRVDPAGFDPEWKAVRLEANVVQVLEGALESNRPRQALESLLPSHPGYGRLRDALARYRELEPWAAIPDPDEFLLPGDPRTAQLWARLQASGDLPSEAVLPEIEVPSEPPKKNDRAQKGELGEAVKGFQRRHGLGDDGIVGPKTLAALNVPLRERVQTLELNLERWRWLPRDLGARYVLVDVPGKVLRVVEDGVTALELRVIVGRTTRRTPVMSDRMTYLVLNPSWEVPPSLAVQDKLPEIKKDPSYLEKNGFLLLQGWGADERKIDPSTVDWSQVGRGKFPYRLRQLPGPKNALGEIKFMFPNPWNIYIHDTPGRELFGRAERAQSSGCIRVERHVDLAAHLLGPPWDAAEVRRALDRKETRTLNLPEPWPVHLQYWTAAVSEDGTVQIRPDLYGRDVKLAEALRLPPPGDPEK